MIFMAEYDQYKQAIDISTMWIKSIGYTFMAHLLPAFYSGKKL